MASERGNEIKAPAQPLMCVRIPYGGCLGAVVRKTLERRKACERGRATPVSQTTLKYQETTVGLQGRWDMRQGGGSCVGNWGENGESVNTVY